MFQGVKRHVTNLPRPWQIVAAGGAISCGERANILWRPPKDVNFLFFCTDLLDAAFAFLDAKIQNKSLKCKLFSEKRVEIFQNVQPRARDSCVCWSPRE